MHNAQHADAARQASAMTKLDQPPCATCVDKPPAKTQRDRVRASNVQQRSVVHPKFNCSSDAWWRRAPVSQRGFPLSRPLRGISAPCMRVGSSSLPLGLAPILRGKGHIAAGIVPTKRTLGAVWGGS